MKEWIENIFDDTHVFVSSSDNDIVLGEKWEETMMKALIRANVAIILVSKKSYDRKWIHIETGFCMARELKLMIIRIDDLLPEKMGRPYDNYQSLAIKGPENVPLFSERLLGALSQILDKNISAKIGYDCLQRNIEKKVYEVLKHV